MKRNQKLRIGFIGTGGIAALQLSRLYERPDVEVVALADLNPKLLEQRQARDPKIVTYTDYRRMLRHEDLDAVSVCTPNDLHAQAAIAAMRVGCDVLVEKPMAKTTAEARRMYKIAEETGRALVIGFQYRLDPRTQYLRRLYDEGAFGEVVYGRVQALRRRGIPNWGVFGRKEMSGGGPLIDIGVHVLEMAHYTMGSPQPVSASADMFTYLGNQPSRDIRSQWAGWDHENYTVEDLAIGRVRFDNGAVINVETAYAAHLPQLSLMNYQLMGTQGGATWEPCVFHTDEAGHMVDKSPAWLAETDFNTVFKSKMDAFVDHLLHQTPCVAPAKDGVMVQSMLNAMYDSAARGGKEVRIKPV